MAKRLIAVDPSKCSGCRYCELWCSFAHEGVFSPSLSRISVVKDDRMGMDYPVVCRMCSPAPCIKACPHNALVQTEEGIIRVIEERCTGCGRCVKACPFGAVKMHPAKAKPLICDLCGGGEPVCVLKCPTGALRFYPVGEVGVSGSERAFDKAYTYALSQYKALLRRWGINVK
ncbi:MAG: 4Fe-4S dicluster domain-containing protein [Thermoprotei archaeon]|nr:MAG: 4Fe-4S dicluster domain-containing protein [Thermoprotei archaeon]